MARIIGGSMIGELSGKLGGNVFARNKSGAYIRQYVIPVDPRTIAQVNARSKFGAASSNFHALTPEQKANWQNFASNVFNPKTGKLGVSSGFNAFVSLNNVVLNAKIRSATFKIDSVAAPATAQNFGTSYDPPAFALESNLIMSGGGNSAISLSDITMEPWQTAGPYIDIPIKILYNITGLSGPMGDIGYTEDAKGNYYGFKAFMSNPVAQPGVFVQNPYLIDLGTVKPVNFTTPVSSPENFEVSFAASLLAANYQALGTTGQYVEISVFQVSQTGMLLKSGSRMLEITQ